MKLLYPFYTKDWLLIIKQINSALAFVLGYWMTALFKYTFRKTGPLIKICVTSVIDQVLYQTGIRIFLHFQV